MTDRSHWRRRILLTLLRTKISLKYLFQHTLTLVCGAEAKGKIQEYFNLSQTSSKCQSCCSSLDSIYMCHGPDSEVYENDAPLMSELYLNPNIITV